MVANKVRLSVLIWANARVEYWRPMTKLNSIPKKKIPEKIVELGGHLSCTKYPLGSDGNLKSKEELDNIHF